MNKQTKPSILVILALIITTLTPLNASSVEYPAVNITWICDLSYSAELMQDAYNLFTGLFNGIAGRDSNVITISDDNAVIPWIDNTSYAFGGQANVVGAFHCAKEQILSVLGDSDEQIQLIAFSDLCQTASVNEARESVSGTIHADRLSC
jgi:hypothetical protein